MTLSSFKVEWIALSKAAKNIIYITLAQGDIIQVYILPNGSLIGIKIVYPLVTLILKYYKNFYPNVAEIT